MYRIYMTYLLCRLYRVVWYVSRIKGYIECILCIDCVSCIQIYDISRLEEPRAFTITGIFSYSASCTVVQTFTDTLTVCLTVTFDVGQGVTNTGPTTGTQAVESL